MLGGVYIGLRRQEGELRDFEPQTQEVSWHDPQGRARVAQPRLTTRLGA